MSNQDMQPLVVDGTRVLLESLSSRWMRELPDRRLKKPREWKSSTRDEIDVRSTKPQRISERFSEAYERITKARCWKIVLDAPMNITQSLAYPAVPVLADPEGNDDRLFAKNRLNTGAAAFAAF